MSEPDVPFVAILDGTGIAIHDPEDLFLAGFDEAVSRPQAPALGLLTDYGWFASVHARSEVGLDLSLVYKNSRLARDLQVLEAKRPPRVCTRPSCTDSHARIPLGPPLGRTS